MDMEMIEQVYDTLMGNLTDEYQIPGIENAFHLGNHVMCCILRYFELMKKSVIASKPRKMTMWSV